MLNIKKNNIKINHIPFITISLIVCISLFFIMLELIAKKDYVSYRLKDKISSAEYTFNNEISNAKHIVYGLGATIAEKQIISNRAELNELIKNFDRGNNFDQDLTTILTEIIFVDSSQEQIIRSYNKNKKTKKEYINIQQCLTEKNLDFFKPHVGIIRIDNSTKEPIIPISMTVSDQNGKLLGTLCSGIFVRDINKKLNLHFDSRYLDSLNIINSNLLNSSMSIQGLSNLIEEGFFYQENSYFYKIQKYPFTIEVKPKHSFLKKAIYRYGICSLILILIFSVGFYYFYNRIKRPLIIIKNKLDLLNQFVGEKNHHAVPSSFRIEDIFDSINNLIDEKHKNFLEGSINNIEKGELKKKILNLIFIEQHFLSHNKTKISEDKILSSKLYSLINEDLVELSLKDFVEQFISYCSEFYHEVNIHYEIKENKKFSFKQSTLIECLMSIINLISRSSIFAEDIYLEAKFIDNDNFPIISIKTSVIDKNLIRNLGWEEGPLYASSGLITIYLLAKENNLFLNISKIKENLIFTLEPISQKVDFYNHAINDLTLKK